MKSSLSRSSNTKKWIFEPIDLLFLLLICAAAAEPPPRCQWISSWLQLGYHFRYKKKASANSRFHHHLCNNTRSKNPFLLFLHPLKKCIVMAANQQLRSKKNLLKITRRKKSVSKHVNILKAAKKSPPLKKLQKNDQSVLKKCWEPKKR
jgi:hypothetical protein